MPSVSLTANEAEFFGLKPEAQKKASATKPAPTKSSVDSGHGVGIKVLLCVFGFVSGGAVAYSHFDGTIKSMEFARSADASRIQALSIQVDDLNKALKAEKEKILSVPAPEFPASPMFQSAPQVQPQPQPQPVIEKQPEPVKKSAPAQQEHIKPIAAKPVEKPQAPVASQVDSSAQQVQTQPQKVEATPPKFLPVLMLPSNKTHVASVGDGSIVWRFDNGTMKTIKVGEPLPSNGETLMGVDPSSSTLWTDKQIISIIKE